MEGWKAKASADLTNASLDKNGNLTLTFTIAPGDKYDMLPISDIRGRAFTIEVSTSSKRVFAGKEGIEEARNRVLARKAARNES